MSLVNEKFVASLVAIAKGEVGVRESGSNRGVRVELYQKSTWMEPGPWPWCAAFVCWCLRQAHSIAPTVAPLPDTPRAFEFEKWGRLYFDLVKSPESVGYGDLVIYDFSHIGIACTASRSGKVWVVEGNTDGSGGRDGDGVYLRRRSLGSIRSVVKLK